MQARFGMIVLLPLMVSTANGTDIYKCTGKNGTVSYSDTPCPSQQTTLLHKETEAEAAEAKQNRIANTVYRLLDSGHDEEARDFAAANGVSALYRDRVQANVRHQQEQRAKEVAQDAQMRREMQAEDEARHQKTMQEMQDKRVAADAAQEKFRKEHWSEIKQQHPGDALQSQSAKTFNSARGKWCTVGKDGSTVCE
ncbi:DUF4124 domain-containing protein [Dyella choica]|uniref:DUF4124 domain-containing protein n=1 Tax=Dyella choica TaxID=1927959 RepID=A0A432M0W9_9GAMM|nr:DUF4124 domain-containing protein [Dyella choica]RUL70527.1 DUF4124 domain-containing protein [Dyella choica]